MHSRSPSILLVSIFVGILCFLVRQSYTPLRVYVLVRALIIFPRTYYLSRPIIPHGHIVLYHARLPITNLGPRSNYDGAINSTINGYSLSLFS
jgi:hypothetical protein